MKNGAAPPRGSSIGSDDLARKTRRSQLNQAHVILIGMGLFTIIFAAIMLATLPTKVQQSFEKRVHVQESTGKEVAPEKRQQEEDKYIQTHRMMGRVYVAVGVIFVMLGLLVLRLPVPATVTSLVLYVGTWGVLGIWEPITFTAWLLMKILVAVCLWMAVLAALAAQRIQTNLDAIEATPDQLYS